MNRAAIKNWSMFQHYRGRKPPWIKLHRSLLDDREYIGLPMESRALAPLLWLLASEDAGQFCADSQYLAFRLRLPEAEVCSGLKPLIDNGFIVDASSMLAERYQHASPDRDTETDISIPSGIDIARAREDALPDYLDQESWNAYAAHRKHKRAAMTPRARELVLNRLADMRSRGLDPNASLLQSVANGWTGVFDPKTKASSRTMNGITALEEIKRGLATGGNPHGLAKAGGAAPGLRAGGRPTRDGLCLDGGDSEPTEVGDH